MKSEFPPPRAYLLAIYTPARIRTLRKRLGLKMSEFGRSIGVSQPTVSQYEAGLIIPGWPVLILIDRLNVVEGE